MIKHPTFTLEDEHSSIVLLEDNQAPVDSFQKTVSSKENSKLSPSSPPEERPKLSLSEKSLVKSCNSLSNVYSEQNQGQKLDSPQKPSILEEMAQGYNYDLKTMTELLFRLEPTCLLTNLRAVSEIFERRYKSLLPLIQYLISKNEINSLVTLMRNLEFITIQDLVDCFQLLSEFFSSGFDEPQDPIKIEIVFCFLIQGLITNSLQKTYVWLLNLICQKLAKSSNLNQSLSLLNCLIYYQIEISTQTFNRIFEELGNQLIIDELIKLFEKSLNFNPKISPSFEKTNQNSQLVCFQSGLDYNSFLIVIKVLCNTGNLHLAKNYFYVIKSNKLITDDSVFLIFFETCSKTGRIEEMKQLYNEMSIMLIRPSITTINTLIEASIKSKNIDCAWKVYCDMDQIGITLDNFTLTTLFKGIKDSTHLPFLNKAITMLENLSMKKEGFEIILVNVLIDSCLALKEFELAESLFNKAKSLVFGIAPDVITFNTFIKGCAQMGYFHKAIDAFDSIPEYITPNDVTINTMIDISVKMNSEKKKNYFIGLLREYEIRPDNFTYSTIIKGMNKKSNSLSEAFQLFDVAKMYGKADEILYNCIMDACLKFGEIDKMLEVFNEMKKNGIKASSISYGILIKAHGMNKEVGKSIAVYEQMKKEKVEISAVTYGCLINACIKNDKTDKAFELFQEMYKAGIGLNCILYTTMIKAYSKTGNVNKVLEIFEKMKGDKEIEPNNVTYNSVLDCLVRNEYLEMAENLLTELSNHETLKPDIISFSTIIKGYLSIKNLEKPVKLLKSMEELQIKPDEVLLNSLLDGCDKMKEYELAVEIFNHVRRYIYPSLMSFSIMMKVFGKLNRYEDSRKLIVELRKNKEKISLIIYTCYMRTCFNSRKGDEAMEIFQELSSKKLIPDEVTFKTMLMGFSNLRMSKHAYIALISSLDAKRVLKLDVYEKVLNCIYSNISEDDMFKVIERIRGFGIFVDPSKYVDNFHKYNKQRTINTNDMGMDYVIQNYKYKNNFKSNRSGENDSTKSNWLAKKNEFTKEPSTLYFKEEPKLEEKHSTAELHLKKLEKTESKGKFVFRDLNNSSIKNTRFGLKIDQKFQGFQRGTKLTTTENKGSEISFSREKIEENKKESKVSFFREKPEEKKKKFNRF